MMRSMILTNFSNLGMAKTTFVDGNLFSEVSQNDLAIGVRTYPAGRAVSWAPAVRTSQRRKYWSAD
ncbi:hypothetical protein HG15A2_14730 [Adhaeretor mobilis]|uniref:Uncharacterized protein n=1 Tax=Adhaeretor mobilis TaxID=1930276 RepID=A0A517MTJ2_9BACT|nr:hypothetical protein HG15A2_14730 [Adhaeretor mobilis]